VHLLVTTRRPVVEIAFECGYGDQPSFTRQFRAAVGLPPAAYRETARMT
jgi:transcriptional regulator GlxA family with amidase domain